MKAAGYVRVSTAAQAGEDRFGLAAQRKAIADFAAREGIEVVSWFSDEGVSGATLDRPALNELLDERNTFGLVVVARLDRLARSLMGQLWLEKELLRRGRELLSASEPFRGRDPTNILMRQIIGAFAEFERSRIAERMAGGRIEKARRGGYAGGGAPLGYKTRRGSRRLWLDEDKAPTVRRVFALIDECPSMSLAEVAAMLNAEGHTTARGKLFHPMQVSRILNNRGLYEGRYRYAGIEGAGQHEAILAQGVGQ